MYLNKREENESKGRFDWMGRAYSALVVQTQDTNTFS